MTDGRQLVEDFDVALGAFGEAHAAYSEQLDRLRSIVARLSAELTERPEAFAGTAEILADYAQAAAGSLEVNARLQITMTALGDATAALLEEEIVILPRGEDPA